MSTVKTMPKMSRAPTPIGLTEEDKLRLIDWASKYNGSVMVHNHPKTIANW